MTWNPAKTDASLALSNNNLTVAKASGFGSHAKVLGIAPAKTSPRTFKVRIDGVKDMGIGFATAAEPINSTILGGSPTTSACIFSTGWYQENNGNWSQNALLAKGQEVSVSYDPVAKLASWTVNGSLILSRSLILSGEVFPAISLRYQEDKATADFTQWVEAAVEPPPPPPPPPQSGEYYILITNNPDYTA